MFYKRISNPILRTIVEWLFAIAVAVLVFFVVRSFVFRMAHVTGNSMDPTLINNDMVVLNRFAYVFGSPRVGDIVAFPVAHEQGEHYIKRIIAGPGDVVDLSDGQFFVNGIPLDDEFSDEAIILHGDVVFPITVEQGRYFVLGDNRNGSMDSRFAVVGNIENHVMVGRAVFRVWPFNRIGMVR